MCPLLLNLSIILLSSVGLTYGSSSCESSLIFIDADDHDDQISILDPIISIDYMRDRLAVYNYPKTDEVNIFINDTIVSFEGEISKISVKRDRNRKGISRAFNTNIVGNAKLVENSFGEKILRDCDVLVESTQEQEGYDGPPEVKEAILRKAASCIQTSICSELGKITKDDLKNSENHLHNFGSYKVVPKRSIDQDVNEILSILSQIKNSDLYRVDIGKLEKLINRLIDVSLEFLKKRYADGRIEVPDLQYHDINTEWWKPDTHLVATSGKFSDIRKVWKTENVKITLEGQKLLVSGNFKIDVASALYDYQLVWAKIPVSGTLQGTLPHVTVEGLFEYDQEKCRIIMNELNIQKNGKTNIDFTGLGPLNWLVSIILSSQAENWNGKILDTVRDEILKMVNNLLDGFSC